MPGPLLFAVERLKKRSRRGLGMAEKTKKGRLYRIPPLFSLTKIIPPTEEVMMSDLKSNSRILQVWRRLWGDGTIAKSQTETVEELEINPNEAVKEYLTLCTESPVDVALKKMMKLLPAGYTVRIDILDNGYSLRVLPSGHTIRGLQALMLYCKNALRTLGELCSVYCVFRTIARCCFLRFRLFVFGKHF